MAWAIQMEGEVVYETEENQSWALLLHWAGEQKVWLFLAVLLAMAGACALWCPILKFTG